MKKFSILVAIIFATVIHGYRMPSTVYQRTPKSFKGFRTSVKISDIDVEQENLPVKLEEGFEKLSETFVKLAPALSILLFVEPTFADASAYGIFAGRTASLLHPFTNFALFATSIYSAYLGLQWRRIRDLGEELKSLSSSLPKLTTIESKFPISEKIKELEQLASKEGEDQHRVSMIQKDITSLKKFEDLDTKYKELTETRKKLLSANLRDKHHLTGSILLGVGVTVSILGAFNTYMRSGRLFPGPHLYAGMAITILWAVAAALVPAMQKGNEVARVSHIALNVVNIALFAWQIPTGIEILFKVLEKTSWP